VGDFKKIRFGYASSEKESAKSPELLINGYVDLDSAFEKAVNDDEYLFLGYKGSGKSAIGKKLELLSKDRFDLFCKVVPLRDFPFTQFSKMVKGTPEPEARLPTAWAWLLLLFALESLSKDGGVKHDQPDVWQKSLDALRAAGVLGSTEISTLVRKSSKRGFTVGIPKIADYSESSEYSDGGDIRVYVEAIFDLLRGLKTDSSHIVVIDGLDDIITKRESQFTSIGSLILELGRINQFFHISGVKLKIIMLCRTDLFEKTSNANKNKVRQDDAVELDWYHDPKEPQNSMLIKIANTRASLSMREDVDVFSRFFPSVIDHSPSMTYCLDMTRHTPRDFLQLLSHVQKFSGEYRLTQDQIKSGLRDYSIKYFLAEIRDELDGYCSQGEIDAFIRAASRLKKREFAFLEFVKEMEFEGVEMHRSKEIMQCLFECSAAGNVSSSNGKQYYSFKFRNRNSVFNSSDRVIWHRGVWKALNI